MLQRYHDATGTASFDLLPAIDLRDGRVVRLVQGDFDRETSYGDDPVATARAFVDDGAMWLHVVDLDGARAGKPAQLSVIGAIVRATAGRARCEAAGGLRSPGSVDAALTAGVARVVVGTAALRSTAFATQLVQRLGPDRVAIAIDVRDGYALGDAWGADAIAVPVETAIERLADAGARIFEVTAVDRDGLLGGPDLALLGRVVALRRGAVIASAGIGSLEDLLAVRDLGCSGAIVGRALLEGRFSVADALSAVAR
ncbi:MAG: 1-(5-phosphoribosyl)-5-[(5-phosphoribosylamino)methylideneamino] imidazole-4-carboxamide isomerase [Chloroflexi bacterium]|nr:1-(5-phosphoribosyl)-5-[(5-phosphoribosylamino)methylideneamino] imidazole-4-carboxamide isomerase [Chloroflexota bacterium]